MAVSRGIAPIQVAWRLDVIVGRAKRHWAIIPAHFGGLRDSEEKQGGRYDRYWLNHIPLQPSQEKKKESGYFSSVLLRDILPGISISVFRIPNFSCQHLDLCITDCTSWSPTLYRPLQLSQLDPQCAFLIRSSLYTGDGDLCLSHELGSLVFKLIC